MARFSHMPDELICEIAGYLLPDGIESFSLASSAIFDLTLPYLTEHRRLQRRYRHFRKISVAVVEGLAPACTVSDFVVDVLTHERVRRYIKTLGLYFYNNEWVLDYLTPSYGRVMFPVEQSVLFKQALSTYIRPEKVGKWISELKLGKQAPLIGLLLIRLTKLNSIRLVLGAESSSRFKELIERIKTDCVADAPVLSHLELIDSHGTRFPQNGGLYSVDLSAFLATIPSLTTLRNHHLSTLYDRPVPKQLPSYAPNITSLAFKSCRISLAELNLILQSVRSLQYFTYIFERSALPTNPPWDPAILCKLLTKYSKRTLEGLEIRSQARSYPIRPIDGFQDFTTLQNLALSIWLFECKPAFRSSTLMSQLPGSIRRLILYDIKKTRDLVLLQDSVPEAIRLKPQRLPGLRSIWFDISEDLGGWLKEVDKLQGPCRDVDIEFCMMHEWLHWV